MGSISGKVILLNGCSSSGKTTLALKVQEISEEPFHYISLDQFRDGMPPAVRGLNSRPDEPGAKGINVLPVMVGNRSVTDISFGDFGERVLQAMRVCVAHLASSGCSVVVDDILFESAFLTKYSKILNPRKTWVIGVRCDLAVVKDREAQRAGRFPGTAEAHFDKIHKHGIRYDLEVDSTRRKPAELAREVMAVLKRPPKALINFIN